MLDERQDCANNSTEMGVVKGEGLSLPFSKKRKEIPYQE